VQRHPRREGGAPPEHSLAVPRGATHPHTRAHDTSSSALPAPAGACRRLPRPARPAEACRGLPRRARVREAAPANRARLGGAPVHRLRGVCSCGRHTKTPAPRTLSAAPAVLRARGRGCCWRLPRLRRQGQGQGCGGCEGGGEGGQGGDGGEGGGEGGLIAAWPRSGGARGRARRRAERVLESGCVGSAARARASVESCCTAATGCCCGGCATCSGPNERGAASGAQAQRAREVAAAAAAAARLRRWAASRARRSSRRACWT
jgi:hypothetical protein